MKIRTVTMIGVLLITFFPAGDNCFGQNRDRRDKKLKDYHGTKDEFHPRRRRGPENRIPIVVQRFRSINGSDNNLDFPTWGQAGVNLRRRVTSNYADGFAEPSGADRISAREISNLLCDQPDSIPNGRGLTSMVWQWGQFLDHDVTLTESAEPHEAFPIMVASGDIFFDPFQTGTQTIPMFRSEYRLGQSNRPREQINSITSWIDASNVYGSDVETSNSLRTFTDGLMKTSAGDLLPVDDEGFFLAGDVRANEQPGLTSMHTLFVREHNRIAMRYKQLFPQMTDTQIFLRARKRVAGIMQAITYNEFLPAFLGKGAIAPYRGLKNRVNPNISNTFSTAAYRFGHSMLPPELLRLDENFDVIAEGNVLLRDAFFNPAEVKAIGIDPYIRGLVVQQAQEVDTRLVDDLRNFLFGPPGSGGFDLASLNIQRGRDHGLPDYNTIRMGFQMTPVSSFEEITSDPERQLALETAYGDVNEIDPWVGMLSEDHVPGSSVGPTLRRILGQQFEMIRDADRFWYELEMHPVDVKVIGATRLANVIYRNTNVRGIPLNVFQVEN